ncbi:hypothetical protein Hanom_Chr13g01239281 [Helianthus anomalus]
MIEKTKLHAQFLEEEYDDPARPACFARLVRFSIKFPRVWCRRTNELVGGHNAIRKLI